MKASLGVTDAELDELTAEAGRDESMWSYIGVGLALSVLGGLFVAGGSWATVVGVVLLVLGSAMTLVGCVGQGVFLGVMKAKAHGL